MNQTFSIKRFSQLFVKHTAEHYKTYVLSYLVLLGVLFLVTGFAVYQTEAPLQENTQVPVFMFFMILAGCIFASTSFADYGKKNQAISLLTLPASQLEKYLVGWVYSFVVFQALFVPSFYMVVSVVNNIAPLHPGQEMPRLMSLTSAESKVYEVFLAYAVLHSVMLLGSVFFKRTHYIKTSALVFAFIALLGFINNLLLKSWLKGWDYNASPFNSLWLRQGNKSYPVELPDSSSTYLTIVFIAVTLILWVGSFYMLKEKEV